MRLGDKPRYLKIPKYCCESYTIISVSTSNNTCVRPLVQGAWPSIGASLISIFNRPYNTITSTPLSPNRSTHRRGAAPTIKIHKHHYNQQSPQPINGATFPMCTLNFEVCDDFLQRQQKCGSNDSGVGWLLLLLW